jgi:hypothetical protein
MLSYYIVEIQLFLYVEKSITVKSKSKNLAIPSVNIEYFKYHYVSCL